MRDQLLDQMELERERGITIKLQPVRMLYQGYILNLIDTPGHVDFSYEVSRSLAAVEGAILLVDATQGIEAQTLANLYLAMEQDLVIIPVINKIDLPNAKVEEVTQDLVKLLGVSKSDILTVSAKTGENVKVILQAVIKKVPPPTGELENPLQILIFDSFFDEFKGVVAFGRVMNGEVKKGDKLLIMGSKKDTECLGVGIFKPMLEETDKLSAGEIGYLLTGLKEVLHSRVGDTITLLKRPASQPLPGYKILKPMVFAGIYCKEGDDFSHLRDALEKITLNDSSIIYEPDHSEALGFGFRCGFLGILHLDIFQERLTREYNMHLIVTAPSVAYKVILSEAGFQSYRRKDKSFINREITITSPLQLPEKMHTEKITEPWVTLDIVTPTAYLGNVMTLAQEKRAEFINTEYLDEQKAVMHYNLPLASILVDFYDKLKSVSAGYASMNYQFLEYRTCDVIRLDVLVAQEPAESLATIVYTDEAFQVGRKIVEKLKDVLPRQLFEVKIQAAIGSKIIASSRIPPLRKDVTAKLYGGDVSRKRKLLEKQKKGKKRMKQMGKVEIPQEAFLAILKR